MFNVFKQQQLFSVLSDLAILLPVFLIIFTWRGFIKALVAKLVGDDTAQRQGFLTLNPLAHIDFLGMLLLMGVFFVMGGLFYNLIPRTILLVILIMLGVRFSIPVPIDEGNFKHHRMAGILTSLSGPIGMFTLAFISTGLLRLSLYEGFPHYVMISLVQICKFMIDLSLFFCVVNLVPIPPFDAGSAIRYALPPAAQPVMDWLEERSLFIFLILYLVPVVSDIFFGGIFTVSMLLKKMMFGVFF